MTAISQGSMYYLKAHIRIVAALLIREISARFGDKPGGYIWAVIDPVGHIAFMSVIFMAISRHPALGISFPLFFATGYVAFQFFQGMSSYLDSAISANRALLHYPNVAPIDTIVARYILQMGTTTIVAVCVFTGLTFVNGDNIQIYWPYVIEGAFSASLLAVALSLVNNVMSARISIYDKVFAIFRRPLFLTSGVFFRPDIMPHPLRDILLLNPVCHSIMLFRMGFYSEYRPTTLDMDYLYTFTFCVLFAGLLLFSMSREAIRGR
jgi:capsular polysaccharide transport system permease protein